MLRESAVISGCVHSDPVGEAASAIRTPVGALLHVTDVQAPMMDIGKYQNTRRKLRATH